MRDKKNSTITPHKTWKDYFHEIVRAIIFYK